jgi:hypothetical protein
MRKTILIAALLLATAAQAQTENYESWPLLKSTFPSTGGGGFVIKGYDPVIIGKKCVTTFMAVERRRGEAEDPARPLNFAETVYPNYIEFEAVPASGGTLCKDGKWRAFEGGATGETPFRLFFKNGMWRGK